MKAKVALITGAAGAIGRAIATRFAVEGASLCLCDCDSERLDEFVRKLAGEHGPDCVFAGTVDVRESVQVSDFVSAGAAHFGRLDVLINNAAVTTVVKIDDTTDEQIDRIIDTDLKGYFYFAREAVRLMKNTGGGSILIISSKNGLVGASEKSLYSATKAAELAMARSLAQELGPFGIRVNSICPDAVHEGSKIWERGGEYSMATAARYGITEEDIPDYYRERCSLKTNITPNDVANAALFLATDQSRATTGAILTVDGGVAYVR